MDLNETYNNQSKKFIDLFYFCLSVNKLIEAEWRI